MQHRCEIWKVTSTRTIFDHKVTIIVALEDDIEVLKMERKILLKKAEFTFINEHVPYSIEANQKHLLMLELDLSQYKYIYPYMDCVEFVAIDEFANRKDPLKKMIDNVLVYRIFSYFLTKQEDIILELVYMLFANYQLINRIKVENDYYSKEMIDRYYKIHQYVIEHIHDKISAQDILDEIYINNAYLTQFMKRLSHNGFKDYVAYRKLMYLLEDVVESKEPFFEIALDYNITDMKTFYKLFKKVFKKTPSKIRKELSLLQDDYVIIKEKDIVQNLYNELHYEQYQKNAFDEAFDFLSHCQKENIDLKGTTMIIEPFSNMHHTDTFYQPFSGMEKVVGIMRRNQMIFGLKLQYHYVNTPFGKEILNNLFYQYTYRIGLTEMKKWKIYIVVKDIEDLKDAKEFIVQLTKQIGKLNIECTIQLK